MTHFKSNKIDSVSPLGNGFTLSPRKKHCRSKSTGSLGSHASTWNEKSKQSWIRDNFFYRDCFKFVANPKKTSGNVCCCGRFLSHHKVTDHNTLTWTPATCTKKMPTNAFGEIQFIGSANQSARAPYVRLAEDTNVNLVMKLILKIWKLEVPNLVISVTGGAKSFHLKPRLKEVFQRGLIKAAKSTGAWIITGGTNTGVMKHVGEAVRQMKIGGGSSRDINVIGIATWGIVDRAADITSESGLGQHPARYRTTPEETTKAPLDSSHTHFLLVDNGTVGQYGVEIDLRSKVEEAISKLHTESRSTTGSIEVPVVMLVLEGGPGTLKTMTEAIKKKIPAVVIDGSGRAADVVSFAYKHTISNTKNGKNINVIDQTYKELVEEKIVDVFGKENLLNVYKMIEDVVEDEKMVFLSNERCLKREKN